MGGSPPVGTYIATVRDFVLMGKIGSTPQRVQWSPLNSPEGAWGSIAATQADFQDVADGGNVTGLVGGEYALIFQETSVRRMTYEGPPIVFRIDKIANDIGASVPGSVASLIDMAFFLHKSGFYMVRGGQTITPIGRGKVDRTFWAEFDETNQFRSSAAIDPVRGLYVFAYPATDSSNGVPNRLLIYNWRTEKLGACQGDLRDRVRRREPAELHARTARQLQRRHARRRCRTRSISVRSGPAHCRCCCSPSTPRTGAARFSGATLAATVETAEFNPGQGTRIGHPGCRPLIDGGARRSRSARGRRSRAPCLWPGGRADTGWPGAGLPERSLFPGARGCRPATTWSNMQGIDDLDVRPAGVQ